MEIGMVGLGKMGSNMSRRLTKYGHKVVAFDAAKAAVDAIVGEGIEGAYSLEELVHKLNTPRIIWIMVPAGEPTTSVVKSLAQLCQAGDLVIDGGNSKWKQSLEHQTLLADSGIHFMDVGVSGGIWGLEEGYCLMIGGSRDDFDKAEPIFKSLAPEDGYAHVGPVGAGHFVKMVHNGIEYALLAGYSEGFEILAKSEYDLDLPTIAKLWNHGSVIRSWLLELAYMALSKDPRLEDVKPWVEDTGEGRWTVETAIEYGVPVSTIAESLFARFRSRDEEAFASRFVAALRHEFGGHEVKRD
jgi:6-phosphogluconate dehydrogenase